MEAKATTGEPQGSVEEIAVPSGKLVHTVAAGETLSGVANKYDVSMADITLWNGLEDAALTPGQKLTVFLDPKAASPAEPAEEESGTAPVPEPPTSEASAASEADDAPRPAHYAPKNPTVEYVVQSGDTLLKISREFHTTTDVLMQMNEIKDAGKIFIGQKLRVPAPK
jgi:peptidoglycan endopeptidase LytE